LPNPTLPKGGGAIAPIGEKFVSNPQTGTAAFSIPLFTSPGRGGFGPKLELAYDAGAGNGPFGLGWSLSVPNIARKTDKGVPRYDDANQTDVFVLSGAEDLVPVGTSSRDGETVVAYRPRVDHAFARIERHLRGDGTQYWVAWTRDNVRSVYGYTAAAQIADPEHPQRVFRWMLEWTDDDKGNVIAYLYKPEDDSNLDPAPSEHNRRRTNLYLKAIAYANPQPRAARNVPPIDPAGGRATALASWPLVVLFDYGEHDPAAPTLTEGSWPARADPFSWYRSGFEIRTHRLCRRVLMLHKFAELGSRHVVVRSTELAYTQTPAITYLTAAMQVGWQPTSNGGYHTKAMPAITMGYGQVGTLDQQLHTLDPDSARNLPDGLGGAYALLDYDGEGLPGVLSEQAGRGWFYQRPAGRDQAGRGRFDRVRRVEPRPDVALAEGFQLQDVNADGLVDLVRVGTKPEGVFERRDDQWTPFRPFPSAPDIDWADPNLRLVDLDGDGFPDVLIADQDQFRWHPALGRDGFAGQLRTAKPLDRLGPVPLFATDREAVLLADMTGDGLSDLVAVKDGSVCYWPNLGYGRFGPRVQMAGAPRLDTPDGFDPRRVHLADVDGTGTSDLIYPRGDGVHVFLNQAGNAFAAPQVLRGLPAVHDFARFLVTDLWGTGTACLVWSSPLPADRQRPLRWVDLLRGHKPHLLETVDNGLGTTTTIEHAPSTRFYLEDRAAQLPWITKLPMPVHVVASVTVQDAVSRTKFVTTYRYHHGFYDGLEREFRGFGMVEQRDTQQVAPFYGSGEFTGGLDQTLHIPPAIVKTWYHTGAFVDARMVSTQLAHEYWAGDPQAPALADSHLPDGLAPDQAREAYRALGGQVLRQETYAEDQDPDLAATPYLVTESNYTVQLLHAKGDGRHGVFAVHPRETLQLHDERHPADPRIQHHLVVRTSPYGDVVDEVAIGYPRRANPATPAQGHLWATWTHHDYQHLDTLAQDYRVGIPTQETTAELAALTVSGVLGFDDVAGLLEHATVGDYDPNRRPLVDPPPAAPVLLQRVRHYYWDDALSIRLGLHTVEPRALPYQSLTLALNATCLQLLGARAHANETADAALTDPAQAGYTREDNRYWSSSGTLAYDAARFFLPVSLQNAFGGTASVAYDPALALLPVTTTDAAGLSSHFEIDWRLLAPRTVTDATGTRSEVTFDPLGVVTATAVHGAAGEGGPTAQLDYAFYSGPELPSYVHTRTFPAYDPSGPVIEESYLYCDGLGREVLRKVRAEDGPLADNGPIASPRWVGTGRTVYNNKALPVKKYEPYFSDNANYETEAAIVKQGVTSVLSYDPLGRLIRVDQPNGTFRVVAFDAWSQTTSDENDTVLDSRWYHDRTDPATTAPPREQAAATATAAHAHTPRVDHLDPLGRAVLTILDNAVESHETLTELDSAGNALSVTDPEHKLALTSRFDLAGRAIFTHSADAGKTWTLPDAAGAPLVVFRAQGPPDGLRMRLVRDPARRLSQVWVWNDGDPPAAEALRERVVYGPAQAGPPLSHGRVSHEFDSAGMAAYAYDFGGNPVRVDRRVTDDYHVQLDWRAAATFDGLPPLPAAVDATLAAALTVHTVYDALGRPTQTTTPDNSVTTNTYNVGGLLETVTTRLGRRAPGLHQTEHFVTNIDYDAKGRRTVVDYGNGVHTRYRYDPETFRLTGVVTDGPTGTLQDLSYVYDPVGNVTSVEDAAQPAVCFANQLVRARGEYVYDAVYRLTSAKGREHPAQAGIDQRDLPQPLPLPTDCAAIVPYQETYRYTKAGNIWQLAHTSFLPAGPLTTTRTYAYDGATNRLQSTSIGPAQSTYTHNDRGDMTAMPHLDAMACNHRDQLIAATRTRRGNGPSVPPFPQLTNPVFMAYDLRGERVRKVSESGNTVADRVYLGPYEIYREHPQGGPPTVERETLHVADGAHRVAVVETLIDGSNELVRYQFANHLGSAVLELDAAAKLLSYEEFHPYGTTSFILQGSGVAAKRYRFIGKERDEETGLDCCGVRYYAPWLGRWTSPDPAGMVDGANLYQYARNAPIGLVDVSGMKPELTQHEIIAQGKRDREYHERVEAAERNAWKSKSDEEKARDLSHARLEEESKKPPMERVYPRVHIESTKALIKHFTTLQVGLAINLLTLGMGSGLLAAMQTGAATSAAESVTGQLMDNGSVSLGKTLADADQGALFSAVLWGGAKVVGGVVQWVGKALSSTNPTGLPGPRYLGGGSGFAGGPKKQRVFSSNPRIAPHGVKVKGASGPGWESHHPESQTALPKSIESYNPNADITLKLPEPQHILTYGPQASQRATPGYAERLGTPQALKEAVDIIVAAKESLETAGQVVLEHAGYLFSTVPLNAVPGVLSVRGF